MEFESSAAKAEEYRRLQDAIRKKLTEMEDDILATIETLMSNAGRQGDGPRWLAIGRTHIQEGFMSLKRGVYEGKQVGDP